MTNQDPSYQVFYWNDGVLEMHPQRFFFDPSTARSAAAEEFEQDRDAAMQDFDVEEERRQTQQELTQGILDRFDEE